ncbi:hypothetical protein BCY86_03970 [Pajaroellobacter abortibovis]|uniref:Uncharacterized protein n=1 Tax=Pajaroellobacter abortibovis TaxID=1882918 RepID=A0A1L6MWJ1_9BACT|nr:hypothetical protein BCY86_03970 [Pajaroellobacter abortibovis]
MIHFTSIENTSDTKPDETHLELKDSKVEVTVSDFTDPTMDFLTNSQFGILNLDEHISKNTLRA